jgi:hypothetical protein
MHIDLDERMFGLAPTPLYHHVVEESEALNRSLLDFLDRRFEPKETSLARAARIAEIHDGEVTLGADAPLLWSTTVAYVPMNHFLEEDDPAVAKLLSKIREAVAWMGKRLRAKAEARISSSWVQTYGSGDWHVPHNHARGAGIGKHGEYQEWSGAYYIDDGDPDPARAYSGVLSFQVHGTLFHVKPRPGLLLLWPSHLFHQVNPFHGSRRRVMISWNLEVTSTAPRNRDDEPYGMP